MPDYQKGKIYSIRSHQTEEIYIGSTTQTLFARLASHKRDYKRYKKDKEKCFISSFHILQFDDAYIELYENCPCNCKEELTKREGEIIRELNCVNKKIEGRTLKEYYIDNKDKILKYYIDNKDKIQKREREYRQRNKDKIQKREREYRQRNKDKIAERKKEYNKEYRQRNKDKILKYYIDNKEKNQKYAEEYYIANKDKIQKREREYRQRNKDKIAERRKEYYKEYTAKNRDEINNKRRAKFECECGVVCNISSKARHFRGVKHINYLNSKEKKDVPEN